MGSENGYMTVLKHTLVWVITAIFLAAIFLSLSGPKVELYKAPMIIGIMAMAFYANTQVLLPRYYAQKKVWQFILFSILLVLLLSALSFFFKKWFFQPPPHFGPPPFHAHHLPGEVPIPQDGMVPNGRGIQMDNLFPPPRPRRPFNIDFLLMNSAPAILGLLLGSLFFNYRQRILFEKEKAETLKSEKDFLVSQINPHFLFNSLNTILALNLENPKSSKAILALSDMLNYSIYKGQEEKVKLEDEINYISHYINLFLLRDDELANIQFLHESANRSLRIAPMLLIPFVENAFKHGNPEDAKAGRIKIEIETSGNQVTFQCENSCADYSRNKDSGKGIGIQNVKRRLDLIYPGRHQLKMELKDGQYSVSLTIETDEL